MPNLTLLYQLVGAIGRPSDHLSTVMVTRTTCRPLNAFSIASLRRSYRSGNLEPWYSNRSPRAVTKPHAFTAFGFFFVIEYTYLTGGEGRGM